MIAGLDNVKFIPSPPMNIKLSDRMVIYNNGFEWRIIPIYVLIKHRIIHDKIYYSINESNKSFVDATITYCPGTKTIVLYEANLTYDSFKNGITFLKDKEGNVIEQYSGKYIKSGGMVVKNDIYTSSLKQIYYEFRDCNYLHYDSKIEKVKDEWCHVLEYRSKSNGYNVKHILIVSNNIRDILNYIESLNPKITEKGGIVIPTNKKKWLEKYPKTKIIML